MLIKDAPPVAPAPDISRMALRRSTMLNDDAVRLKYIRTPTVEYMAVAGAVVIVMLEWSTVNNTVTFSSPTNNCWISIAPLDTSGVPYPMADRDVSLCSDNVAVVIN